MEEGLVVRGRMEIDSRQPFKSVKEAVLLFEEKVLVGEIYAHKLKEMGSIATKNKEHKTKVVFGDTKQTLEISKDERKLTTYYLMALKQQLDETKSELSQLKSTIEPYPSHYMPIDPKIEEIKYIQNPKTTYVKATIYKCEPENDNTFLKQDDPIKFKTPMPTKVIVEVPKVQDRSPSYFKIKKTKKKTLIPLLNGTFSKKQSVMKK